MSKSKAPDQSNLFKESAEGLQGIGMIQKLVRVDLIPTLLWKENPKLHDIGGIWEIIKRNKFVDVPKFDINLTNVSGDKGALVFGNGRSESIHFGWQEWSRNKKEPIPDGIFYDNEFWYIPVNFGLDAESEAAAEAFGIEHNTSTMMGGNFVQTDYWGMYDTTKLAEIGQRVHAAGVEMVSLDDEQLDDLWKHLNQEIEDVPPEEFPEYDEDIETEYCCPKCGYEWSGAAK